MKPCLVCSRMGCRVVAHGFATNAPMSATNKVEIATNRPLVATNKMKEPATNVRTKNRRDRESYNAYQREYMRKRRLKVLDAVGVDQVELGLCRT